MNLLAWAYGAILFILPSYLFRFSILGIPTTALEVCIGVFLLATLSVSINKESVQKIKRLGKINWAILLFVAASILSVIASPETTRALGQLKAFIIEPILLFYAGVLILNTSNVNLVLRSLFFSAVLVSIFGIVQYATHLFLPLRFWGYGVEVKRITSIFEYPNALALYLAPIFAFFLALEVRNYRLIRPVLSWLGLIAMFMALILTYSRGAWVAAMICSLVIALTAIRISVRKLVLGIMIVGIAISPLLVPRFKLVMKDGASSERLSLYSVAVDKIIENPIFGNGLYGFRSTLESHPEYTGEILNYPHNILLNFWLETGFFGLIGISFIIALAYKKYLWNATPLRFAAGLFILAIVAHGMFDAPYFKNDLAVLFWFAITLFFI